MYGEPPSARSKSPRARRQHVELARVKEKRERRKGAPERGKRDGDDRMQEGQADRKNGGSGKGERYKQLDRDTVHSSRCSAYRVRTSFLSFPRCPPAIFYAF